jgi:hypothetical protein
MPIGLLVAMVSFDGRIRSSEQIERLARVQLLVSIPYVPSTEGQRRRTTLVVLLFLSVFAAYVVAYLMSQTKVV